MTNIAYSTFPAAVWDGLSYQYDTLDTDKDPSFFWKDKASKEIIAVEQFLVDHDDLFNFFDALGAANSYVGVKADLSGLTYREFVAGAGVTIVHTDATTTITAIGGGGGTTTVTLKNEDAASLVIGTPVYTFNDGGVKKAKADAEATTNVIGLATETITAAATGEVQTEGVLAATTGEWDTITGQIGGLTPDSIYYLSGATAGQLTAIAPSIGTVAPVGTAISSTQLKLNVLLTVLL